MGCPRCGGMSAADFDTAMGQLVKTARTELPNALQSSSPIRQRVTVGTTTRGDTASRKTTIGLLSDALAAEVICILRYKRQYFMTAGISTRRVKTKFLQHVAEEQVHAAQLADRIVQLGGKAMLSLERLLNRSDAEHTEGDSLEEMITADLLAERRAIHNYRKMIATLGADDPTTKRILESILAQEETHAENLASLLRS